MDAEGLLLLVMGGSRLIYRLWKEQGLYRDIKFLGEPVLVLGTGDAAAETRGQVLCKINGVGG